jgi:1-acyl-sn-glycerol-3-phosphate acyltransferase
MTEVREVEKDQKLLRFILFCCACFNKLNIVKGFEVFGKSGGMLVVTNHPGIMDFGLVTAAITSARGELPVVVAKKEYSEDKEFSSMLRAGDVIFIDRESGVPPLREVKTALESGRVVLIALPMTYDIKADLYNNKGSGIFSYAKIAQVPIVAISVVLTSFSSFLEAFEYDIPMKSDDNLSIWNRVTNDIEFTKKVNNTRLLFLKRFRNELYKDLEINNNLQNTQLIQEVALQAIKELGDDRYDVGKHVLRDVFKLVKQVTSILSKIKLLVTVR